MRPQRAVRARARPRDVARLVLTPTRAAEARARPRPRPRARAKTVLSHYPRTHWMHAARCVASFVVPACRVRVSLMTHASIRATQQNDSQLGTMRSRAVPPLRQAIADCFKYRYDATDPSCANYDNVWVLNMYHIIVQLLQHSRIDLKVRIAPTHHPPQLRPYVPIRCRLFRRTRLKRWLSSFFKRSSFMRRYI